MPRTKGMMTAERFRRLHQLNQILATDSYVLEELAARFGVSVQTIVIDRDYIWNKWWPREESAETEHERMKQVEFLKLSRRLSMEAYQRSRQDKEEITTRYDDKLCEDCNGTGRLPQSKCFNCDGTGHVTEEIVSRKVSGTPGDVAFLREARQCTESIGKFMGLNKPPIERVHHMFEGKLLHEHRVNLDDKYRDVDPELVIEAKAAIMRLEEAAKQSVVEGRVIDEGELG